MFVCFVHNTVDLYPIKWATLTRPFATRIFDPPVRPALPVLARSCPALRVKPTRFQAYSSRTGTQEGIRLASQTPSNYY